MYANDVSTEKYCTFIVVQIIIVCIFCGLLLILKKSDNENVRLFIYLLKNFELYLVIN